MATSPVMLIAPIGKTPQWVIAVQPSDPVAPADTHPLKASLDLLVGPGPLTYRLLRWAQRRR